MDDRKKMIDINKKVNILKFMLFVGFVFFLINGYGRISNYVASGLMPMILFICISKQSREDIPIFICFILYYIFYIVTSVFNYQSFYYLFSTSIVNTLLIFVPIFLGGYINIKYNIYQKKKYLIAFLIVWFLVVIVSTRIFSSSQNGGRDFASEHTGAFLGGGYCATYGSALLVVIFFTLLVEKGKFPFGIKMLLATMITVSLYHIISTESTITLFSTILGIVLVIIYRFSGNHIILRRVITGTLIICAVIFILNIRTVGFFLMNYSKSVGFELYSRRIYEVGTYLAFGEETWHMGARLTTITNSINTFMSNPLVGIGYRYGNEYSSLASNGVGQHSELLDSFAQCGIIGGGPFVAIFLLQLRKLVKTTKAYITIPFIVTFILLFIFNPFLSAQTNFVLFMLIPLVIDIFDSCYNELEEV